jgi:hypothetical protein
MDGKSLIDIYLEKDNIGINEQDIRYTFASNGTAWLGNSETNTKFRLPSY